MDILQSLFSLWTGNRCKPNQQKPITEVVKKMIPENQQEHFFSLLNAYCENLERQAFDVGFKTAIQLWKQLESTEDIDGGITQ